MVIVKAPFSPLFTKELVKNSNKEPLNSMKQPRSPWVLLVTHPLDLSKLIMQITHLQNTFYKTTTWIQSTLQLESSSSIKKQNISILECILKQMDMGLLFLRIVSWEKLTLFCQIKISCWTLISLRTIRKLWKRCKSISNSFNSISMHVSLQIHQLEMPFATFWYLS